MPRILAYTVRLGAMRENTAGVIPNTRDTSPTVSNGALDGLYLQAGSHVVGRFGAVRTPQVIGILPVVDRVEQVRGGLGVHAADVGEQSRDQHVGSGVDVDLRRFVGGHHRDRHVPSTH